MGAGGNADQRRATDFAVLDARRACPSGLAATTPPTPRCPSTAAIPTAALQKSTLTASICLRLTVSAIRFIWTAFGMDAIDQFQVQTSGYSAQYAGQGVQNYSIKQGTNEIHGAIYEYIRNTVLDAWPFSSKIPTTVVPKGGGAPTSCKYGDPASPSCVPGGVKPAEIMNEVGLRFGGPIIKNKLFLFYNYGQYRYQNGPARRRFRPFRPMP